LVEWRQFTHFKSKRVPEVEYWSADGSRERYGESLMLDEAWQRKMRRGSTIALWRECLVAFPFTWTKGFRSLN